MRVLVIGSDPNIFVEGTESHQRTIDYAGLFEELHIISEAKTKHKSVFGNLYLWPVGRFLPFGWLEMLVKAYRLVKSRKIDIVDTQDPGEYGLLGWIVSRLTGTRWRAQVHTDILSPYYRRASWKERVRYYMAKFLIPRANYLRVVSERIKKSVVSGGVLPAEKITVLPIYTDINPLINSIPNVQTEERFNEYPFRMIAMGRFVDKEKNFSMLIEVMNDFVKTYPRALLVIVGDGPDRNSYQLLVNSYKLQKNVVIETWRNDLPSFLKFFDLFVLPSKYEGWGRAVIEAMASGLPILMTDVGVAGEVVSHGKEGLVVPVGDRQALLRAMINLYNDKERLKQFGESAVKKVLELNPKTKREYLELYKESFKIYPSK